MRHGKKINHLGRTASHRKAMLSNMACSLIENKRINTTVAKAKALRKYVEPLITKSKTDDTHNRRVAFSYLKNKYAVTELFREVAAKVGDRPGGYTRIIKTGTRLGDNAEMCMIELVDFNEMYEGQEKKAAKKTTRRGRRGGGKKVEDNSNTTQAAPAPKPEANNDEPANAEKPAGEAKDPTADVENHAEEKKPQAESKKEQSDAAAPKKEQPKTEAKKEATSKKDNDTKKEE